MRYKTWRSRSDYELHAICGDGSEAFEALPVRIRNLGPWAGGKEGEVKDPSLALSHHACRSGVCNRFIPMWARWPLRRIKWKPQKIEHARTVMDQATFRCTMAQNERVPKLSGKGLGAETSRI